MPPKVKVNKLRKPKPTRKNTITQRRANQTQRVNVVVNVGRGSGVRKQRSTPMPNRLTAQRDAVNVRLVNALEANAQTASVDSSRFKFLRDLEDKIQLAQKFNIELEKQDAIRAQLLVNREDREKNPFDKMNTPKRNTMRQKIDISQMEIATATERAVARSKGVDLIDDEEFQDSVMDFPIPAVAVNMTTVRAVNMTPLTSETKNRIQQLIPNRRNFDITEEKGLEIVANKIKFSNNRQRGD